MNIMEDLDEIIETTEKNLQGLKEAKEVINRVFLDSFYHNWSIDVDVTGNVQKKPKVLFRCYNRSTFANCMFVFSYCFANKQNKKKLKLVDHRFYSVDCWKYEEYKEMFSYTSKMFRGELTEDMVKVILKSFDDKVDFSYALKQVKVQLAKDNIEKLFNGKK
jgi:hypothetical protein